MDEHLTTRKTAKILGVNSSRVRQFIDSGNLEARKFGLEWVVSRDSVKRLLSWRLKIHENPTDLN